MNTEAQAHVSVSQPEAQGWHVSVSPWSNAVFLLLLVVAAIFLFHWLWNTTMPEVFGLKKISVWQVAKLLMLVAILFGPWLRWAI